MGAKVPFLVAGRLTRSYGATLALDHVDLAAARGSVLAVLGPERVRQDDNGADLRHLGGG